MSPTRLRPSTGVRALSYQAEISRTSPTAILMVMDQSTSMNHRLNSGQSKAAFLADVLNKTLYTIITNCSKSDGVRDYFHVGVVAYGAKGRRQRLSRRVRRRAIACHLPPRRNSAPGRDPHQEGRRTQRRCHGAAGAISHLVRAAKPRQDERCARVSTRRSRFSINGARTHPSAFPPTVLHVTDGHPSDGDPEPTADRLKSLATSDGGCLLFNLHVDAGRASR